MNLLKKRDFHLKAKGQEDDKLYTSTAPFRGMAWGLLDRLTDLLLRPIPLSSLSLAQPVSLNSFL